MASLRVIPYCYIPTKEQRSSKPPQASICKKSLTKSNDQTTISFLSSELPRPFTSVQTTQEPVSMKSPEEVLNSSLIDKDVLNSTSGNIETDSAKGQKDSSASIEEIPETVIPSSSPGRLTKNNFLTRRWGNKVSATGASCKGDNNSAKSDYNSDGNDGFIDIDDLLSGKQQKSVPESAAWNSSYVALKVDVDNEIGGGSPAGSNVSTLGSSQDPIILSDDESTSAESETDYSDLDIDLTSKNGPDSSRVDTELSDGDSFALARDENDIKHSGSDGIQPRFSAGASRLDSAQSPRPSPPETFLHRSESKDDHLPRQLHRRGASRTHRRKRSTSTEVGSESRFEDRNSKRHKSRSQNIGQVSSIHCDVDSAQETEDGNLCSDESDDELCRSPSWFRFGVSTYNAQNHSGPCCVARVEDISREREFHDIIGKEYIDGEIYYMVDWTPTLVRRHVLQKAQAQSLINRFEERCRGLGSNEEMPEDNSSN